MYAFFYTIQYILTMIMTTYVVGVLQVSPKTWNWTVFGCFISHNSEQNNKTRRHQLISFAKGGTWLTTNFNFLRNLYLKVQVRI